LKVNEQLATTKSLAKDLGLTFTSAFEDAIVGGKKFSDVLSGIDQDIERMLIRRTVTEPLGNLVDGLISGFDFGSLFNANGNAFNSSGVMKFANGGIFNSATAFKFANGGQMSNGILGEAGPEAILPLTRGKNGKLGVASEGGGSNVTVNVINNAGGVSTEVQKKEDGQGNISLDIIIDKIEASMSRNIKQGRGIAPAMETQYGLNRVAGVY
jgi:phage-related minor tail protein